MTPLPPSDHLVDYINVKLSLLGFPPVNTGNGAEQNDIVSSLVAQYREK